jgi:hypothetical protein
MSLLTTVDVQMCLVHIDRKRVNRKFVLEGPDRGEDVLAFGDVWFLPNLLMLTGSVIVGLFIMTAINLATSSAFTTWS